jgi:hypothetical protein
MLLAVGFHLRRHESPVAPASFSCSPCLWRLGVSLTKRQGIDIGSRSIVELHRGPLWAEKTRGAVQSFCSASGRRRCPRMTKQKYADV